MAYEFKKISNVEIVAEPTDSANVLIEENGVIKKAPKTAVGGVSSWDAIFDFGDQTASCEMDGFDTTKFNLIGATYDELETKIKNGEIPKILVRYNYMYGDLTYTYLSQIVYACSQYDSLDFMSVHMGYNTRGTMTINLFKDSGVCDISIESIFD
ncbi:MAG: hypothetical protein IKY26_06420 [Erysipelotrichaceae bacterium]|nr:hypothetical protein [Erysipelotrichaceae bacterium]